MDQEICRQARLSRDARFDGQFFIAVKTTGIYCRPICPVQLPREENVRYYTAAIAAAEDGYRPCLRCRPDAAPGSNPWRGVNTTLDRALNLINAGELSDTSMPELASRLGITDRYLRQLFQQHLGVAPKRYAQYQQCLMAKQLLHTTTLPITDIALASGFQSVRRFNDCFRSFMKLSPSEMRREKSSSEGSAITLHMSYRPPFNWAHLHGFLARRAIAQLEIVEANSYARSFEWAGTKGVFRLSAEPEKHRFKLELALDDLSKLRSVCSNIRRLFDLDADSHTIDAHLTQHFSALMPIAAGIRLPGTWSLFEAGVRAILGQQVSVVAAKKLVEQLVAELGEPLNSAALNQLEPLKLFPTPTALANSDLAFLKMPNARRETLRAFAQAFATDAATMQSPDHWQSIKGIGPWTIDYAKMRGLSNPDIYLGGDLGVKNRIKALDREISPDSAAPWRSYLTQHLWHQPPDTEQE